MVKRRDHLPEDIQRQIAQLKNTLPANAELLRLLAHLDDPASDDAAKDRYTALVAGNAVESALRVATGNDHKSNVRFVDLIDSAEERGLVTRERAHVLHRVREVRNVFAHAVLPCSFQTPEIAKICDNLVDHPVTDWAAYFSPIFTHRVRFALVCSSFINDLLSHRAK